MPAECISWTLELPSSKCVRFVERVTNTLLLFTRLSIRLQEHDDNISFAREGKLSLPVDLKNPKGVAIVKKLAAQCDVIIESFRPGTMERLGLGPDELMKANPRLIFARLLGYGQYGPLCQRSGHDPNFAGYSGVLPMLGRTAESLVYPSYVLSFSSSALLCAYSILAAVIHRDRTGTGQVIDLATSEAIAYCSSTLFRSQDSLIWYRNKRLFYLDVYETYEGKWMSVAPYEPTYFEALRKALHLEADPDFIQNGDHDKCAEKLRRIFRTKTQGEWIAYFKDIDACVTPVLDPHEAADNAHNVLRNNFFKDGSRVIPHPAPKMSVTPPVSGLLLPRLELKEQVKMVLAMTGTEESRIEELVAEGVLNLKI